jgi:hypothetical protein
MASYFSCSGVSFEVSNGVQEEPWRGGGESRRREGRRSGERTEEEDGAGERLCDDMPRYTHRPARGWIRVGSCDLGW